MLLDDFVPDWDVRQIHATDVVAPLHRAYEAVKRLDLGSSGVNRLLFSLRGLCPVGRHITLSDLMARGFVELADDPPREIVLGLVSRPWTLTGGIRRMDAASFARFHAPGYAKIGWNFSLHPLGARRCRVRTETRILCTDVRSGRRFRRYWRLIAPFSGVVRRGALAGIRKDAERSPEIHGSR